MTKETEDKRDPSRVLLVEFAYQRFTGSTFKGFWATLTARSNKSPVGYVTFEGYTETESGWEGRKELRDEATKGALEKAREGRFDIENYSDVNEAHPEHAVEVELCFFVDCNINAGVEKVNAVYKARNDTLIRVRKRTIPSWVLEEAFNIYKIQLVKGSA